MGAKENTVIVVGAGIAGLLSALWAQACGYKAILIERGNECGGLLGSFVSESGQAFDYGTHIPSLIGEPVVDHLMFGAQNQVDWIEIPALKKGNFFHGYLNTSSQFIDITRLPHATYTQALSEMINAMTTDREARSLQEALVLHFGETLTEQVFTPLLKRIYRSPFERIDANAHRFLAYARVIVGSAEVSRELKKSPVYDAKFAFRDSQESGVSALHLYPRNGGTGAWIAALVSRLTDLGGEVLTDATIKSIAPDSGMLDLSDGRRLSFDKLVWTAPVALLAKLLFPEMKVSQPDFVPTGLHHLVLDRKPLCDSHYLYMNDPQAMSFRITLYPNITQRADDYRITIEAVADSKAGPLENSRILAELIHGEIVPPDTRIVESHTSFLPHGFPELTLDINAQNEKIRQALSRFANVRIGGRGAAEVFFMNDVLKALVPVLQDFLGSPGRQ